MRSFSWWGAWTPARLGCLAALCVLAALACTPSSSEKGGAAGEVRLLNVSYDPTRELYAELNPAFAGAWEKKTGQRVKVEQSHGGSGKQARAVLDGLEADIVTLALPWDLDALHKGGLLGGDWASRLPNQAAPYTSTVVFVVRAGNPKGIKGWAELGRDDVQIITANPKTSGGARWNYLAAWGWALRQPGGSPEKAEVFLKGIFSRVPVLDAGARGASTSFARNGLGDVLLTWENEARLLVREYGADKLEIVTPAESVLTVPPVAWVDKNVARHKTQEVARAYLEYLYTDEAQEVIARHGFRPSAPAVLQRHEGDFPKLTLFRVEEVFGSWDKAHQDHFADGGSFDRVAGGR